MLTALNDILSIFDLKTIILISVLYILAYILLMLHIIISRRVYEGFQYIIAGHAFALIGLILNLILREKIHPFFSIFLGNFFLISYLTFYYIGLLKFHRIGISKNNIIFLLLLTVGLSFVMYSIDDLNTKIVIYSTYSAIILILASVRPLLSNISRHYKIQQFMSIVILPLAVFHIFRAAYTFYYAPYTDFHSFIQDDVILKILFLLSILTAFVMFYCYLAMTGDRLAMELKEARQRELEAMQNQQKLFSVITHDLKTPITAINRSAQMIAYKLSKNNIKDINQRLNTIRANTLSMLSLIEQYENNALLMTKGIKLDLTKVNVLELLTETLNNYSLMTDRKIKIFGDSNIPLCEADKQLLQIVFNNVIDNAIKYSDHDTVIEVSVQSYGDRVIVVVQDKGVGIPESEIKNITNRFYRGSNVQQYKGSGVGLHTSALIIALHNGFIDIKSELNKGTIVTITLPVKMS